MSCASPSSTADVSPRWDLVVVVLAAIAYLVAPAKIDPDLWGHVRFGQDMLRDGMIHQVDPYSYLTEGSRWINHEVLSEISFAWTYNHFGALGLSGLRVAIVLGTTALALWRLMGSGLSAIRAGTIVIAVYYGMSVGVHFVRPQLFTYLFFALILLVIDRVDRGHTGLVWAAPPIIALWANFHGGFLAGIGVLGVWLAATLIESCVRGRSLRPLTERRSVMLMGGGLTALFASLATPYGWSLVEFLLRTATVPRPEIVDWQPVALLSMMGLVYIGLCLASLWAIFRGRQAGAARIAAWVVAAWLPLSAARHLPLLAIASGILLARSLAVAWNRAAPAESSSTAARPDRRRLAVHLAVAGCLLVLAAPRFTAGICVDPNVEVFPERAVSLIKQSGVEANLATHFGWGEFVIWKLGPGVQVSVDGRRETIYPPNVYYQNLALLIGSGDWDAILKKHPTDLVLAPRRFPMFERMSQAEGWSLIYEDDLCGLYVREDFPQRAALESVPPPQASVDPLEMRFN
jgi:hypothetical protein